jgi:hypothetical protein
MISYILKNRLESLYKVTVNDLATKWEAAGDAVLCCAGTDGCCFMLPDRWESGRIL